MVTDYLKMEALYFSDILEQAKCSTWCKMSKRRSQMDNNQQENLKNYESNRSISSLDKITIYTNEKRSRVNNKHSSKELKLFST
jgi:hypothetical protein